MSAGTVASVQMSVREAEVITEQIVGRLDQVAENIDAVQSLMRDALHRHAHLALGYESPTAYMRDRFEGALANLSAALRREIVHELSDAGMSTRAIAPIVGVSHMTVSADLRSGVRPFTPDRTDIEEPQAQDEGGVTAPVEETPRAVAANPVTGEVIEDQEPNAPRIVVGIDGKTYKAPHREPQAPRSEPIPSRFTAVVVDINRVMNRLRAVSDDPNFSRNKKQIAALHGSDLRRIITELEELATSLEGN